MHPEEQFSNDEMFPDMVRADDPNRRYTTPAFNEWIKTQADVAAWDLDVAADAESHLAPRWFSLNAEPGSAGVDGLKQSWLPPDPKAWMFPRRSTMTGATYRIFCNPPFDDLGSWLKKTWETIEEAYNLEAELFLRIGWVLPGDRHEQEFWQEHIEPFRDGRHRRAGYYLTTHFPRGRIAYAKPGSNGEAVGSAFFPSAVLIWRRA